MISTGKISPLEKWRLSAFKVVKYNPKFYDKKMGKYTKDEWTSFSDIGEIFEGKTLTYDEYVKTESEYIKAIQYFFLFHKCERIKLLSKRFFVANDVKRINDPKLEAFYFQILKRRILSLDETLLASRLILRGALIGILECRENSDISVRFDYDYYMFFCSPFWKKLKLQVENNFELFTE